MEKPAQLVPNWKLMTMPETTPMPKATAKIFSQKKYRSRHRSVRLTSHTPSMNASHAAVPMVKAGNRMWKDITHANCRRERNSAVSIGTSRYAYDGAYLTSARVTAPVPRHRATSRGLLDGKQTRARHPPCSCDCLSTRTVARANENGGPKPAVRRSP